MNDALALAGVIEVPEYEDGSSADSSSEFSDEPRPKVEVKNRDLFGAVVGFVVVVGVAFVVVSGADEEEEVSCPLPICSPFFVFTLHCIDCCWEARHGDKASSAHPQGLGVLL